MDELKSINLICDDSYALQPIEKSVFAAVQKYFYSDTSKSQKELG